MAAIHLIQLSKIHSQSCRHSLWFAFHKNKGTLLLKLPLGDVFQQSQSQSHLGLLQAKVSNGQQTDRMILPVLFPFRSLMVNITGNRNSFVLSSIIYRWGIDRL